MTKKDNHMIDEIDTEMNRINLRTGLIVGFVLGVFTGAAMLFLTYISLI